jgi:starch synthase
MKVLFAASEALPFVKVGGLGDVAGALPKALLKLGVDVRVVLPLYASISPQLRTKCQFLKFIYIQLGWRSVYCGIFTADIDGVIYYLIDNEQYFKRNAPYGEYDDGERFAFFSKAVLEIIPEIDFYPDIIHCNDWHTALIPIYLDTQYRGIDRYQKIRTVFSIHNIEFQGKYGYEIWEDIFGIDHRALHLADYGGCVNIMKGAIESANIVSTVSRTYAEEILNPYFSHGLHDILRQRQFKLRGIINGIDEDLFNPMTDPHIYTHYSTKTRGNKRYNKRGLQRELNLPESPDTPLIGMVTRLTPQKGVDLLEPVMDELMATGAQLVVLGTGYGEYENYLRYCEGQYPNQVRALITFSQSMAQKIYASADLFLMPSKSEPCGLAQLIALRYGTVPIVHAVGGLRDTVIPFNPEDSSGNGITFQSFNAYDMLDAIRRGIALISDKAQRSKAMHNGMSGDYSWNVPAKEYLELYKSLL